MHAGIQVAWASSLLGKPVPHDRFFFCILHECPLLVQVLPFLMISLRYGALVNDGYGFPLLSIMLGIEATVVSNGFQIFCTASFFFFF